MADLYEGAPDERQSKDVNEPLSRFRSRYRALTDEEKKAHDDLKYAYEQVEMRLQLLAPGRYCSLAMTALEESCMWAVKQLTS
jgi:hypothetical protein